MPFLFFMRINGYLDENYYGLSRGIFLKYKKDGDGVYNQDLSKNAMLIEVGGVDNTLDELYNTIDVLTEVLLEQCGESEWVRDGKPFLFVMER